MKTSGYFMMLLIALFFGCSPSNVENKKQAETKAKNSLLQNQKAFQVTEPQIVFSWPDSISMLRMKATDSDAFYTGADDYSFYNSQAMEIADSLGIKTASTEMTTLDFHTGSNKHFIVNRSGNDDLQWGIYLYNGIDSPTVNTAFVLDKNYLEKFFKRSK